MYFDFGTNKIPWNNFRACNCNEGDIKSLSTKLVCNARNGKFTSGFVLYSENVFLISLIPACLV